jgi:hypothetical protein
MTVQYASVATLKTDSLRRKVIDPYWHSGYRMEFVLQSVTF